MIIDSKEQRSKIILPIINSTSAEYKIDTLTTNNSKTGIKTPTKSQVYKALYVHDLGFKVNENCKIVDRFINKEFKNECNISVKEYSPITHKKTMYHESREIDLDMRESKNEESIERKDCRTKLHVRLIQIQKLKLNNDRHLNMPISFTPNLVEVNKQKRSKDVVKKLLESDSSENKVFYKKSMLNTHK